MSLFASLRRRRTSRRSPRVHRFEQLEARRLLAAAVWNNAGHAVNVNGDALGLVSPVDVLLVINEINQRQYSSPETGLLPKQLPEPVENNFVDVSCDNLVTAVDALLVINHINNGGPAGTAGGLYPSLACSPQLLESTDFATAFTQEVTLPNDASAVKISFQAPNFDATSRGSIRDAFEIEVSDTAGNPLAFPYAPDRDAVYNWSEDLEPLYGPGATTITADPGLDSSVTVNLAGVPAGTAVRVSLRLVNNDADEATNVLFRGLEIVESHEAVPTGVAGNPGRQASADSAGHGSTERLERQFGGRLWSHHPCRRG